MKEQQDLLKEQIKQLTLELNAETDPSKKESLSIRLEKRVQSYLQLGKKQTGMVDKNAK